MDPELIRGTLGARQEHALDKITHTTYTPRGNFTSLHACFPKVGGNPRACKKPPEETT